jgi:pyruvate/2-oxoglutarate dehydrogenase complex dihydrolipoamide acyltransferase (E2) component
MKAPALQPSIDCSPLQRCAIANPVASPTSFEETERINYGDRWLMDGLSVLHPPAFMVGVSVDMTACKQLIQRERALGTKVNYVHVMLRATGLALKQHPELHKFVAGSRRYRPQSVSVALSVATDSFVAPLMKIDRIEEKPVSELAQEVASRAQSVCEDAQRQHTTLRRFGWLAPFGFLRRWVVGLLSRTHNFRRVPGVMQLTYLSDVDLMVPTAFSSTAIVSYGAVRDRVVAIGGVPVVRPTMTVVCVADHKVWNGRDGERFLMTLKHILEGADL